MKIEDLSNYSNAEKIVLAEQLWDSVSKEELEVSEDVKRVVKNHSDSHWKA